MRQYFRVHLMRSNKLCKFLQKNMSWDITVMGQYENISITLYVYINRERGRGELYGETKRGNLFLFIMQHDELGLQCRMFVAYVLVNIIGLFAPHAAVNTLKSRWSTALVLVMAQHMVFVLITLLTSRTNIPNRKKHIREMFDSLKSDSDKYTHKWTQVNADLF